MRSAQADLTITGPGLAVHVHGDGPVLIADVRGGPRALGRALRDPRALRRAMRAIVALLRAAELRVDVRVARCTVARLG